MNDFHIVGDWKASENFYGWQEYDIQLRDARFAPINNRIWGEGNWVRCAQCPRDDRGNEVYHHKEAHNGNL